MVDFFDWLDTNTLYWRKRASGDARDLLDVEKLAAMSDEERLQALKNADKMQAFFEKQRDQWESQSADFLRIAMVLFGVLPKDEFMALESALLAKQKEFLKCSS